MTAFNRTFRNFREAIEFLEADEVNERMGNFDIKTSINTTIITPTGRRPDGYYKEVELIVTFSTEQPKFNYN